MLRHVLISALAIVLLSACKQSGSGYNPVKERAFKRFVARQRLVDLPLHFDLGVTEGISIKPFIVDSTDSFFIAADHAYGGVYGIYKDTSKYFLLIALYAADTYIPGVILFDKQGNLLREQELLVDGCGADCGYYCNAIADIYRKPGSDDIQFYARDSVYTYDCDSLGQPTPGTTEHYVKYMGGHLNPLGYISKKTGRIDYIKKTALSR